MPQDHAGMINEGFCQLSVDLVNFLAISRRGITVIVTLAKEGASAVFIHPQDFRVSVCQPVRTCSGRSGQVYGYAMAVKPVDDLFHPVKLVVAFLRFQHCPGKNPKRNAVDSCFFKILQIFFQDIWTIQPLIRIIVTAMEKMVRGKWV